MSRSAFDAYIKYCAVKAHFDTNYDYFKYNGKIRRSEQQFAKRRDRFMFNRLAKRRDLLAFLVANLKDNNYWVGELLEPQADDRYNAWRKIRQGLSYFIEQDCRLIADSGLDYRTAFEADEGQPAPAFTLLARNMIQSETFVVLTDVTDSWDRVSKCSTIAWQDRAHRLRKYRPWIDYDRAKMQAVVAKHLNFPIA